MRQINYLALAWIMLLSTTQLLTGQNRQISPKSWESFKENVQFISSKKLARYERYWQDRLTEAGEIAQMGPQMMPNAQAKTNYDYCEGNDPSDWRLVGPTVLSTQDMGYLEEVYVDTNETYIIVSSAGGGLWKRDFDDVDKIWRNVTDDLGFPMFTATEILPNPDPSPNPLTSPQLFASTTGGSHYDALSDFGVGVLETRDHGETWIQNAAFAALYAPDPCVKVQKISSNAVQIPHVTTDVELYVITETQIYKSDNVGASWSNFASIADPLTFALNPLNYVFTDIEVDILGNIHVVTAGKWGGKYKLWRYNNMISVPTWEDRTSHLGMGVIDVDTIYRINISEPKHPFGQVMAISLDAKKLSVSGADRFVYTTDDSGNNWNMIDPAVNMGGIGPKNPVAFDPTTQKFYTAHGGNTNFLYVYPYTVGGVDTSRAVNQGHVDIRDLHFVKVDDENVHIYTANDGGATRTFMEIDPSDGEWNDLTTRENLNGKNLSVGQFIGLDVAERAPNFIAGGYTHSGIFSYIAGIWDKMKTGDGNEFVFRHDHNHIGYGNRNTRLEKFNLITGGSNNITGSAKGIDFIIGSALEIHPINSDIVYWGDTDTLNIFNDATGLWAYDSSPAALKRIGALGISHTVPWNTSTIYMSSNKTFNGTAANSHRKLYKSTDGGQTWPIDLGTSTVTFSSGSSQPLYQVMSYKRISDIVVDPADENHLWVSLTGTSNPGEKKILESTDGGNNWLDYSTGLPPFPCHSIEMAENGDDLLFAGTEVGVYYRDNTMPGWECFSEGLPKVSVTDLEISNCGGEIVAGTHGRSCWRSPIPSQLIHTQVMSSPVTGIVESLINITVPSGQTLVITGELQMAGGKKITVEPNARLLIDGGKITNTCDRLWQGVELIGDQSVAQLNKYQDLDPNHGTIKIINGGTLEHAKNAIRAQGYGIANSQGGRIFAKQAQFINCRFAVEMLPYPFENVSYFKKCKFWCNDLLPDLNYDSTSGISTFVRMWDVHGVKFEACQFQNTAPSFEVNKRGIGIYALDSDFEMQGICLLSGPTGCNNLLRNQFIGLTKGIVFNSSNLDELMVKESIFQDVPQGIYVNGGANVLIRENEFNNILGEGNGLPCATKIVKPWGIYLESTAGVKVKENSFWPGYTCEEDSVRAVVLNNTGALGVNVENNVFLDDRMMAIHAFHDNSNAVVSCNEIHCSRGIYVTPGTPLNPSFFPSQGQFLPTQISAANQFLHTTWGDIYKHIDYQGFNPNVIFPGFPPTYGTVIRYHTHAAAVPTAFDPSRVFLGLVTHTGDCGDGDEGETGSGKERIAELFILDEDKLKTIEQKMASLDLQSIPDLESAMLSVGLLTKSSKGDLQMSPELESYERHMASMGWIKQQENRKIIELIRNGNNQEAISLYNSSSDSKTVLLAFKSFVKMGKYKQAYNILGNGNMFSQRETELCRLLIEISAGKTSLEEMPSYSIDLLNSFSEDHTYFGSISRGLLDYAGIAQNVPYLDPWHAKSPHQLESREPLIENTIKASTEISVYPNPTNGSIWVAINGNDKSEGAVLLWDVNGRLVKNWPDLELNRTEFQLDLSDLNKGIYILQFKIGDKVYNKRIVHH